MTETHQILRDVWPDFDEGKGIFTYLKDMDIPWPKEDDTAMELDLEYYGNHSGNKAVAPLIYHYTDYDGILPNTAKQKLASIVFRRFSENWKAIWDSYFESEYAPLENYSMEETYSGTGNETGTDTDSGTVKNGGTDKKTGTDTKVIDSNESGTVGLESNTTSTSDTGIYGFNSSESSGSNDTVGSGTEKTDTSNSVDLDRTDTTTYNITDTEDKTETRNLTYGKSREHSDSHTLTRRGNIGMTTSQQMLQSELDLRVYDFWEMVYRDIDKVLCLKAYI